MSHSFPISAMDYFGRQNNGDSDSDIGSDDDSDDDDPVVVQPQKSSSSKEKRERLRKKQLTLRRSLHTLQREENRLQKKAKGLTKALAKGNWDMASKVEEVGRLERKLEELKKDKKEKKGDDDIVTPTPDNLKPMATPRRNAVFIFPEEVWRLILGQVGDWRDLENCSKVCTLFRRTVDPFKTTFPFHEVIPKLYKFLSGHDLLQCRQVCKPWKAGVDNLFENHKSLRSHNDTDCDPRDPGFITPMQEKGLGTRFTTLTGILRTSDGQQRRPPIYTRMMDYARSGPGPGGPAPDLDWNPVIGGNIIVSSRCEESEDFLRAFGQHIQQMTVHDGDYFMQGDNQPLLQRVLLGQGQGQGVPPLPLLPNLRKLRLVGFGQFLRDDLEVASVRTTLAALPNLKTLQINEAFYEDADIGVPHPSLLLLTRFHHQLGRLHVRIENWRRVSHLDWSRLTELHIDRVRHLPDLNSLFKLKDKTPNLKKFGIGAIQSMLSPISSSFRRLLELMKVMSVSSPSLTTFRLSGEIQEKFRDKIAPSIRAFAPPTLKTLEVEHFRRLSSVTWYTFLMHFPLLENLNLFWRKLEEENKVQPNAVCFANDVNLRSQKEYDDYPMNMRRVVREQKILATKQMVKECEVVKINKYIYKGKMYKSNVWELLPRLKVITFQGDVYTREVYEKIKARKQEEKRKKKEAKAKKNKIKL